MNTYEGSEYIEVQRKIISDCKHFGCVSAISFATALFIGNKLTRRIANET
jgi:hypothetical protein